jgi:hypothetical protein
MRRREAMMLINGVRLSTRIPDGDYRGLIRVVRAVAAAYEVPPSQTLAAIFVDDKNCAYYEVDLADDLPIEWAAQFAGEVRDIFRRLGGYNGLIVRSRGVELICDDPWWNEPDEPELDAAPPPAGAEVIDLAQWRRRIR